LHENPWPLSIRSDEIIENSSSATANSVTSEESPTEAMKEPSGLTSEKFTGCGSSSDRTSSIDGTAYTYVQRAPQISQMRARRARHSMQGGCRTEISRWLFETMQRTPRGV